MKRASTATIAATANATIAAAPNASTATATTAIAALLQERLISYYQVYIQH